jgi:hypothetical protein
MKTNICMNLCSFQVKEELSADPDFLKAYSVQLHATAA